MKWTDTLDIAIALSEKHADIDPKTVRFTDLMNWVMAQSVRFTPRNMVTALVKQMSKPSAS